MDYKLAYETCNHCVEMSKEEDSKFFEVWSGDRWGESSFVSTTSRFKTYEKAFKFFEKEIKRLKKKEEVNNE